MVNAKDIDYYANINGAINYLQKCIDENIDIPLGDTKEMIKSFEMFSEAEKRLDNMYNFNELTERLSQINFDDKIKFNKVEEEFGDEYKKLVESATHKVDMLRKTVRNFPKMKKNLLIIEGQGGTGKTYNVEEELKACKIPYFSQGSKINATELYKLAYENKEPGKILLFDDCDSVLGGGVINNLMKHLTDTYEVRRVTYDNKGMQEDGVPTEMNYEGKIIILTNKHLDTTDTDNQALLSRCFRTALPFNNLEKVANSIHIAFMNKNYKKDPKYKIRTNFCMRFVWLNRQYFANDVYSMRFVGGLNDILFNVDDNPNDFAQQMKLQEEFKSPKDARYHTHDND